MPSRVTWWWPASPTARPPSRGSPGATAWWSSRPANERLSPMEFDPIEVTIYGKVVTVLRRL